MPNWVRNNVEIEGNKHDIDRLLSVCNIGDNQFSFEGIIPRPKELGMIAGGWDDKYIKYYKAVRDNNMSLMPSAEEIAELEKEAPRYWYEENPNVTAYEVGERYVKNKLEYGAVSWYNWCCDNWDTKWDSCDAYVSRKSDNDVEIMFDTAWSAPINVYCNIMEQFPLLHIHVQYADEDLGRNCGIWDSENGLDAFDDLEFACEVWGYDVDEILAEREEWENE